jgi:two-component system, cell cycle response regulator DivK
MPEKPSILVVDDFRDGRELLTEYLSFHGFRVAAAQNGQEALEYASQIQPDIILMDLSMPILDGWEATRQLRADPLTKHIIIVAVSAYALPHQHEAARLSGCDAVITKPYDVMALGEALSRVSSDGLRAFEARGMTAWPRPAMP